MNTGATTTTTATGRKVRGDAKLERLSAEQQECLRYWLEEENYPYRQIVQLVRTKFGVAVGKSAVGVYYQRHILPDRHDDDTDAAAFLAGLPTGQFDAATVKHAKALAFNALARPDPHIQTASRLLDLVHRVHKQEIAEKRLALEERRVALREALDAHPPRRPRASNSALRSPAPTRPPRLIAPPTQSPLNSLPPLPTPPPADPHPSPPASVPSEPPPCPDLLAPASPAPLQPTPTPDSSFPSLPSVQSPPVPSPAVPSSSQKTPLNPPPFPAYSVIVPPPAPPPSTSPQTPLPPAPPAQSSTPYVPLPLPANLTPEQTFHLCRNPSETWPFPQNPAPAAPRPHIPYREPTRAEWG